MMNTSCCRWMLVALALLGLSACLEGGRASTPMRLNEPYAEPPLPVRQILLAEQEQGNSREIRLFVPAVDGNYPLLQFQHGFTSDVDSYTELLARLAGYGFVIAAPQMYVGDPSSAPSVAEETAAAVAVLGWLQAHINTVLAQILGPDLNVGARIADSGLFGHSRGGQVAWRMLFDHPQTRARAIAGVDPVDGDAPPFPPGGTGAMVTEEPGAFGFAFPSLVIGMGLGAMGAPGFECAPSNRNYQHFYDASLAPRYEVVASDYGHSDMLNGNVPNALCYGALDGSQQALRVFIAWQLASYFGAVLDQLDSLVWLRELDMAPIAASGRFED